MEKKLIKEIYQKIIKENLSIDRAAKLIDPEISRSSMRNYIIAYCEEEGLELPRQKAGRKPNIYQLKV